LDAIGSGMDKLLVTGREPNKLICAQVWSYWKGEEDYQKYDKCRSICELDPAGNILSALLGIGIWLNDWMPLAASFPDDIYVLFERKLCRDNMLKSHGLRINPYEDVFNFLKAIADDNENCRDLIEWILHLQKGIQAFAEVAMLVKYVNLLPVTIAYDEELQWGRIEEVRRWNGKCCATCGSFGRGPCLCLSAAGHVDVFRSQAM